MNPLIIDAPRLQRHRQRLLSWTLTLGLWGFWIYLWLPLLRPLSTLTRLECTPEITSVLEYGELGASLTPALGGAAWAFFTIGSGMSLWILYHRLRFQRRSRRKKSDAANTREIAGFFDANSSKIVTWRRAKDLVISYDTQGRPSAGHVIRTRRKRR